MSAGGGAEGGGGGNTMRGQMSEAGGRLWSFLAQGSEKRAEGKQYERYAGLLPLSTEQRRKHQERNSLTIGLLLMIEEQKLNANTQSKLWGADTTMSCGFQMDGQERPPNSTTHPCPRCASPACTGQERATNPTQTALGSPLSAWKSGRGTFRGGVMPFHPQETSPSRGRARRCCLAGREGPVAPRLHPRLRTCNGGAD